MRRPYCPTCCQSLYQVDYIGRDHKTVKGDPCGHILDTYTIRLILDWIDAKPKNEKPDHIVNYNRLSNAIRDKI